MRSKLALLGASTLFALLLAEVALRVAYVATSTGHLADLTDTRPLPPPGARITLAHLLVKSSNPDIVYQGRPGLAGIHEGSPVRTNRGGWREDEIPFEKPAGTFRILGLGDSVMFGWKVDERERYLDVLETRLNRQRGERRWETVALALPGYNLMIELEVLKRVGLRYDPDLIIYGFVGNDDCLPTFVSERLAVLSLESFLAHYVRLGYSLSPVLLGRSHVAHIEDKADLTPNRLCDAERVAPAYRHLVGKESMLGALEELAAIGRDTGIPVALLIDGRSRGRHPTLASQVPAGIAVINLTDHFRREMDALGIPSYRHPDLRIGGTGQSDHHPTAQSHGIIADGLFEALDDAGLLPPAPLAPERRPL